MEVNSGGQVLFCFFAPAGASAGHHHRVAQSVDLGNLQRNSQASHPQDSELPAPSHCHHLSPLKLPCFRRVFSSSAIRSRVSAVYCLSTAWFRLGSYFSVANEL